MKVISIKEASQMMQKPEQFVRMAVQLGKIPGAFTIGDRKRKTYFITDEQIKNLMKGAKHEES